MTTWILTVDNELIGAFTTRARAEGVAGAFPAKAQIRVEVTPLEEDQLIPLLTQGKTPWVIVFSNAADPTSVISVEAKRIRRGGPGDFTYDSFTKRLEILVWEADEGAARASAEIRRAALVAAFTS